MGEVAEEWERLAEQLDASPFARPGWVGAWWDCFGDGGGRLAIACVRDGVRVTGVLPLVRRRWGLRTPTNWQTPVFPVLADGSSAPPVLAGWVFGQRVPTVALDFVDAGDRALAAWEAAAHDARYLTVRSTLLRSPYVDLTSGRAAFEQRLGAKRLANLRRRWRRLEEAGPVVLDVRDGRTGLDALLAEGLRVEAAGWKAERGTAITSVVEVRRFYERVARWAAERGWLRLAFLRLDGLPLAFDFAIEWPGSHCLLKTGFDPAYRRFSPGLLLRWAMIGRAFDEGRVPVYDFAGADEPWKRDWTTATRERLGVRAFSRAPVGRALRTAAVLPGAPGRVATRALFGP